MSLPPQTFGTIPAAPEGAGPGPAAVEASKVIAHAAQLGLVHDISQPLSAMRNFVYVLKLSASQLPEEQQNLIRGLEAEIDRAIAIIRSTARAEPQDLGTCDFVHALSEAMGLFALSSDPRPGIAMAVPERPMIVTGSLPVLGKVLFSLIEIAAAGGAGASVSLTAEGADAVAVISTGGPLAADSSRGLGLALCSRIAVMLGGVLAQQRDENGGTVIRFKVPFAAQGQP